MSGVSTLVPKGIKVWNDQTIDNAKIGVDVTERGFGLPILANTSSSTNYQENGWLAYDKANSIPMFSNGVDWTDLSAVGGIVTNSSLVGNGTSGFPLGVAPQSVTPATYYNPILVINGDGIITNATNTNNLIADWMTTTYVTGSTTANITAASLDAAYNNATPSNLTTGTGVYTCSQSGYYIINASVSSTSGGVGDFLSSISIALTNGLATAKIIGWTNQSNLTATENTQFDISVITPMAFGDTVWTQVTNSGGTVNYSAHVSMAYFNGPFV